MIKNIEKFKESIKSVLLSDDGLLIESEGTVFIRSLEGVDIAAGFLDIDGGIEHEIEYGENIDGAIEWFCNERHKRGHGSEW